MEKAFLVYDLGRIPWWQTQVIYAALAELGRRALVFCEPDRPFYCLGYHDPVEMLDLHYCQQMGIPVFRRDLGGGLVYLHPGQLFYQVVLPKESQLFTMNRSQFYRQFLEPVASGLRELGVPAQYVPVADIWVNGCKVSGNGAGEIGGGVVLSGNILLDFDASGFLSGLRFQSSLQKQVVTKKVLACVSKVTGCQMKPVKEVLEKKFSQVLGKVQPGVMDPPLVTKVAQLREKYLNPSRISSGRREKKPHSVKSFKITEGMTVDRLSLVKTGLAWELVCVAREGRYCEVMLGKDGWRNA